MDFRIFKYSDGRYQVTLPQPNGYTINLGNKIDKKKVLNIISKLIDMMEN